MKKKLVFSVLGKFLILESVLLFLPAICSLIYKEYNNVINFLITAAISSAIGSMLCIKAPKDSELYAKEGLVIIGLVWLSWSLIGALPFYLSGEIPSYIDCFFETVSGFTTTGATILTNIEKMSKGMLFWRSFTHWIGGMGVLVFAMAIIPLSDKNAIHLMRAEVPGPVVSKLVPRGTHNAKILYGIYIGLCIVEFIFLKLGGMPIYDSIIHTFSTAGTGGFSCKNASIAAYNSAYIEWVIIIFMFLFSLNFNLYYFIIIKRFAAVKKNSEWKLFAGIVCISSLLIAVSLRQYYPNIGDLIRTSVFQVVTVMSTTGFCTADFNLWNGFSKTILLLLMFVGACAGSTGGGFKIIRIIILSKITSKTIYKLISPKSVNNVKIDGNPLDDETVKSVTGYLIVYVMILFASIFLISINNLNIEETISSVATCFNNVGPGLGMIGPVGNFHSLSVLSKIILSLDMLLGRLEIFPILLIFIPIIWKKKFI